MKKEKSLQETIDEAIREFDKKLNRYASSVADEKTTIKGCIEKRIKVKVFLRESFSEIAKNREKEILQGVIVPILMWTEKNNEWQLNRDIQRKLKELDL